MLMVDDLKNSICVSCTYVCICACICVHVRVDMYTCHVCAVTDSFQ